MTEAKQKKDWKKALKEFFFEKENPQSPLQKEGFFEKHRFVFLSFLVPLVLIIFAFSQIGLYPFGDNQIMVIDMWHQYFPFLNDLQDKLQSGGSLLYTWNGGLGTNFVALIAYYASSPLNLITVFFPPEYLTEAMALIVALKIAFAGAFFCIYLRGLFGKYDLTTVAFSTLYALCSYALGYYWCLMWLDVLALLPLAVLGLHKLIDEGKFRMYTLAVAFIMIGNYYIGVMACMFIALYYLVIYFSRTEKFSWKHFILTSLKALGFGALGACIAMVVLLPTYLSMQNTFYMGGEMPATHEFYEQLMAIMNNLLVGVDVTYRDGLPNIYCGMVSTMLGILYLTLKSIPKRERILKCLMLGFLVLSFNYNQLDFIWHGLHFPNELPYRFSFMFSFVLLTMAFSAITRLSEIKAKNIAMLAAGGFIYIIIAQAVYSEELTDTVIYLSLLFLFLYSAILAIYRSGKAKEFVCSMMLFLVVFGEMTYYAVSCCNQVGFSDRASYVTDREDLETMISEIEAEDPGFYRMELSEGWTCNSPALYTYRGVSQFSSEINYKVTTLMKQIGLPGDPASNSFRYLTNTPVVNSMLNIKYLMGKGVVVDDASLTQIKQRGNSYAYENRYALSLGYMVDSDLPETWNVDMLNPFFVQNNYVQNATGVTAPIFTQVDRDPDYEGRGHNVVYSGYTDGVLYCSPEYVEDGSNVEIVFTSDKKQSVFAFVESVDAETVSAHRANGETVLFENNCGSILSLGECEAGEEIFINVHFAEGKASNVTAQVYGLNEEAWEEAYSRLSSNVLEVTSFSDTKVSGTITADEDRLMMTSIPYEKGWTVKVDGVKQDIVAIKDALIGVNLTKGTHEITFSYTPAGFVLGATVSVVSLAGLIALYYVFKRLNEKRAVLVAQGIDTSAEETLNTMVEDAFREETNTNQTLIEPEEQPASESAEVDDDIV